MPEDQRPYGWSSEMAENLAKSLLKSFRDGKTMFLGTFAICEQEKKVLVFDGLQRMTTLNLMLLSLWWWAKGRSVGLTKSAPVQSMESMLFGTNGAIGAIAKGRDLLNAKLLLTLNENNIGMSSLFKELKHEGDARVDLKDLEKNGARSIFMRNFVCLFKFFESKMKSWSLESVLSFMDYIIADPASEGVIADSASERGKVHVVLLTANLSMAKEIFLVLNTPGMRAADGDLIKAHLVTCLESEFDEFWRNLAGWEQVC